MEQIMQLLEQYRFLCKHSICPDDQTIAIQKDRKVTK